MNTRIRYLKKDHLLVTKDTFLGVNNVLSAEIDTNTMGFKILNEKNKVVAQGATKTLAETKKHVKASLKGLGVKFNDEVRNKDNEENDDVSDDSSNGN